jgi:beta-phosphoglucomutase-like phosphatase (HAD superfamily)
VLQFFKTIAGGDEVERGKPDPAVYKLAALRLGVPVAACLAFEDSDNGAHAAASAGMAVVVVPDLKPPATSVAELSFRILGKLDVAVDHVSDWFTTRDTKFG